MKKISFKSLSKEDKEHSLNLLVAHYFSIGMFMSVQHHANNGLVEGKPSLSETTLQMLFNIKDVHEKMPFTTLNWVHQIGKKRLKKLYSDITLDQNVDMGVNFQVFNDLLIEEFSKYNVDLAKNITKVMPQVMINFGCILFLYYAKLNLSKFKEIPKDFLDFNVPFIALAIQSWFSEYMLKPEKPSKIAFARIQELENKMWDNDELLKKGDLDSYLNQVLEDYKTVKKLDAYPLAIY